MYSRLGSIFVILNVGFHAASIVGGENVAIAGVIVEGISIDVVRWFLCC